jgi:hypothetical protein
MVGKSKNRKRDAEHFLNFSQLHRVLINVNRNKAVQRKGMEMATFLLILVAAGKFSLLSYWHSWASLNQNLTALNINHKQLFKI